MSAKTPKLPPCPICGAKMERGETCREMYRCSDLCVYARQWVHIDAHRAICAAIAKARGETVARGWGKRQSSNMYVVCYKACEFLGKHNGKPVRIVEDRT